MSAGFLDNRTSIAPDLTTGAVGSFQPLAYGRGATVPWTPLRP